jgi:hypothetical protein
MFPTIWLKVYAVSGNGIPRTLSGIFAISSIHHPLKNDLPPPGSLNALKPESSSVDEEHPPVL